MWVVTYERQDVSPRVRVVTYEQQDVSPRERAVSDWLRAVNCYFSTRLRNRAARMPISSRYLLTVRRAIWMPKADSF